MLGVQRSGLGVLCLVSGAKVWVVGGFWSPEPVRKDPVVVM